MWVVLSFMRVFRRRRIRRVGEELSERTIISY